MAGMSHDRPPAPFPKAVHAAAAAVILAGCYYAVGTAAMLAIGGRDAARFGMTPAAKGYLLVLWCLVWVAAAAVFFCSRLACGAARDPFPAAVAALLLGLPFLFAERVGSMGWVMSVPTVGAAVALFVFRADYLRWREDAAI